MLGATSPIAFALPATRAGPAAPLALVTREQLLQRRGLARVASARHGAGAAVLASLGIWQLQRWRGRQAARHSELMPARRVPVGATVTSTTCHASRVGRSGMSRGGRRQRLPVKPGKISAVRSVPSNIPQPPYLQEDAQVHPEMGCPMHPFLETPEIKNSEQIAGMRKACAVAREALEFAGRACVPGATTDDVDAAVHKFIVSRGAYPSPLGYLGFPKSVCTSVNDVIAHGIPDDRPLQDGDCLNVDVTVYVDGYHGDTSSMFFVGTPDEETVRLCAVGQEAMMAGIEVCGPGVDFRVLGHKVQAVADKFGFYLSPLFVGHGIGSYFHGAPQVIPFTNDIDEGVMKPGMTFTVEPILVEHNDNTYDQWDDDWTVQSMTGARSTQFEHTLLITDTGHEILTGPSVDYVAIAKEWRSKSGR